MGFLDNSGDIILDAVLTDAGRRRLAMGNGSFKIAKFALSDDEIDYSKYNKDHTSGSAYYDLDILTTPVLEAFTNNTSLMKSKLVSIPQTNILYLPVLKINENGGAANNTTTEMNADLDMFLVLADTDTERNDTGTAPLGVFSTTTGKGLIKGATPGSTQGTHIRIDQGLDTTALSPAKPISSLLYETQYIVEIDNRFGYIVDKGGNATSVSFIDDDNIATYVLGAGTDASYVTDNTSRQTIADDSTQVINGPRGSILEFKIAVQPDLESSTYLFTRLGSTFTFGAASTNCYYLDSTVRITGGTTGYRVDVPVRYVKKVA